MDEVEAKEGKEFDYLISCFERKGCRSSQGTIAYSIPLRYLSKSMFFSFSRFGGICDGYLGGKFLVARKKRQFFRSVHRKLGEEQFCLGVEMDGWIDGWMVSLAKSCQWLSRCYFCWLFIKYGGTKYHHPLPKKRELSTWVVPMQNSKLVLAGHLCCLPTIAILLLVVNITYGAITSLVPV